MSEHEKIVLEPCVRVGGTGDWWTERHRYCTGSHHLDGREVQCACACHTSRAAPSHDADVRTPAEVLPDAVRSAEQREPIAAIELARVELDELRKECADHVKARTCAGCGGYLLAPLVCYGCQKFAPEPGLQATAKECDRLRAELLAAVERAEKAEAENRALHLECERMTPAWLAAVERAEKAEAARDEAQEALDRDRTGLAAALGKVVNTVDSFSWATEGRGSYELDDDRYREEFGNALRAIRGPAIQALQDSGTIANQVLVGIVSPARRLRQELDTLAERITTIADESSGPHPVQSTDESLSCIERELFDLRRSLSTRTIERDEAVRRGDDAMTAWERIANAAAAYTGAPRASFACPVCGRDEPHRHDGPMSREQLVAIAHRAALTLGRDGLRVVVAVTCREGAWVGVGSSTSPADTSALLVSALRGADLITHDGADGG